MGPHPEFLPRRQVQPGLHAIHTHPESQEEQEDVTIPEQCLQVELYPSAGPLVYPACLSSCSAVAQALKG